MGPEPIWGSTSNVPFLGRCRAPGELSPFLKWVAFITVMNALQRNDMGADTVLANDNIRELLLSQGVYRINLRRLPSWKNTSDESDGKHERRHAEKCHRVNRGNAIDIGRHPPRQCQR